ncbi:MAG: bifunctional adenosylcobinamide kinase/adenosylcobinamide-phosphate guanylyltransferase [Clostridia bacterium]|nr:bifunctional adenosylcobinamide kinase/adenosylcobinamide-phosphate guanylyltransferase [Clostridia bacterium]
MGRLVLVMGENNSGKSAFAEQLILKSGEKRYYIATMTPVTEENHERIKKHKAARARYGFKTLELQYSVSDADIARYSAVLLEDVSNLLANTVFEGRGSLESVYSDILKLKDRCDILVAVTISGLTEEGFDKDTAHYISALNELNEKLSNSANAVIIMKNKKHLYVKGSENDIF